MNKKEALTQLEIMATNATGRLCEAKSEEERALLNKHIEALNMAIDALKDYKPKTGKWVRITKGLTFEKYACSICGRQIEDEGGGELLLIKYPYCHCGAKMERSNNEDRAD